MRQVTIETTGGTQGDPKEMELLLQLGSSPTYHLPQAGFRQTLACWLHCLQQRMSSSPGTQLIYLLLHQHELVITSPTGLSQYWVDFLLQRKFQAPY